MNYKLQHNGTPVNLVFGSYKFLKIIAFFELSLIIIIVSKHSLQYSNAK